MPSKRQRRTRNRRAAIHPDMMALLGDRELNNAFRHFVSDDERRAAWNEVRDEILTEWIITAPGTRSIHWWKFDAPRQPVGNFDDCYYDGKLPEPRRRLGGVGTVAHEVLNYVPAYSFGIPNSWVSQADVEHYSPDFAGVAIDPEDPPEFESSATYLDRLGLLLPGEKRRIRKADWESEVVMPAEDDEGDTEAAPDAA